MMSTRRDFLKGISALLAMPLVGLPKQISAAIADAPVALYGTGPGLSALENAKALNALAKAMLLGKTELTFAQFCVDLRRACPGAEVSISERPDRGYKTQITMTVQGKHERWQCADLVDYMRGFDPKPYLESFKHAYGKIPRADKRFAAKEQAAKAKMLAGGKIDTYQGFQYVTA